MKILLAWLANFVWLLYAGCAFGAILYAARALTLQRRVRVSLTSFERETTMPQINRLWRLSLTFVVLGFILFLANLYVIPRVVPDLEDLFTPTPSGWMTATPPPDPTATPFQGGLPTVIATTAPVTPLPLPPAPTDTPVPAAPSPTYVVSARFGDVADLLGYDLVATEVNASQVVALTLYWQALEGAGAADYAVFTHLLAPDFLTNPQALLAQHDGVPGDGTRSTTGWVLSEVVVDYHELTFLRGDYVGTGQIAVGLYDPGTQQRVPVAGGGDYILLPAIITIAAP